MPDQTDPTSKQDPVQETDPAGERAGCAACRGSGSVLSSLGGEAQPVPCPWCEGGGSAIPAHDAQERWLRPESAAP